MCIEFFFSSRRRHTRFSRDWSSDVCSSDLSLDDFIDVVPLAPLSKGCHPRFGQGVPGDFRPEVSESCYDLKLGRASCRGSVTHTPAPLSSLYRYATALHMSQSPHSNTSLHQ